MPLKRRRSKAKYKHITLKDKDKFIKKSFKTVKASHTEYKGKYKNRKGAKCVVGKLKPKFRRKRKWTHQNIMIPKR